jgi:WD40 repeat protein
MRRILAASALGALSILAFSACAGDSPATPPPAATTAAQAAAAEAERPIGGVLFAQAVPPAAERVPLGRRGVADPIVVPDARFVVLDKQDVPNQRDGVITVIGTEVAEGEDVPPDRLILVKVLTLEKPSGDGKTDKGDKDEAAAENKDGQIMVVKVKRFRRLREGDTVKTGQLLAQLDDRLPAADAAMKAAKIDASKADLEATIKTRDEAYERYLSRVRSKDSPEEIRGAWLTWQRYISEVVSKDKGVDLARLEKHQADVALEIHKIFATIDGEVKTIFKKDGEAVRALETVFQIQNRDRLRVEGLIDVQYLPRLKRGMKVTIEPSLPIGNVAEFKGHLQEITGVAVSSDAKNPLIVSASDDGTVRVWEGKQRREKAVWLHRASTGHTTAVRAVACTPAGAPSNLCLSGAADGKGRLWDLNGDSDQTPRELQDMHRQAITCAAFSPDGKTCATGGDDRAINIWDVATGALRYRLPSQHRGPVTSVQFTPQSQLVSAARDNSLVLWQLGDTGAKVLRVMDRRSGEVTTLGASPDGKLVLFDEGKTLRVLTLPGGLTEAVLQSSGAATFATLALWSPDGQRILTASASDGRLQLWRAPGSGRRVAELRQLVADDRTPFTCAAFSPDGSFIVTGNRDRQVMVWPVPPAAELDEEITGTVTLIDRDVQAAARQVRIWAEVENKDGKLMPGGLAKIVIQPE